MQEMKKISSFILRNLPTIEKPVMPSPSPLGISKQKPMKRTIIRKNKNKKHTRKDLFFKKVVAYLKSDSYMYNPLVSPQPTFDFPPPKQISTSPGRGQEDVVLPIGGSNKKLIEKVVDFLEADCYLYSPLLTNDHVCSKSHPATPSSGHFQTPGGSTSTETRGGQMQHRETEGTDQEGGDLGRRLRARPTVVMKTVAYHESVKHVVQQNCRPKSIQDIVIPLHL